MSRQKQTLSLAAAAAALALSPLAPAADNPPDSTGKAINAGDKVRCHGLNFCSPLHSCAGKQGCKTPGKCRGHGYIELSAKECLDRGGVIEDLQD